MGRRGRIATAAFAGWATAVCTLGGCSVHHYHHFEPAPPAIGSSAVGSPTSTAQGPVAVEKATMRPSAGREDSPPRATANESNPPAAPPAFSTPATQAPDWDVWRPVGTQVTPVGHQPQPAKPEPPAPRQLPPPREVLPAQPERPDAAEGNHGTRLTLDDVINAVLVSDPKLRAGFEAINQAQADALTASLRPNPTLYTDAQLLPLTRPFTVTSQGGPPQQDAQVTYPIDWWLFGKRAAAMAAASHGIKVSEAEFADQIRQRVSDAAAGFYDLLEAKALLALARQDVTTLERTEAATAKAAAAGGRTQIELGRVRLDLARSRQLLRDAETTLVTAKAKLRAMIGRADADPAFDVDGSLDAPLNVILPAKEEGFDLALRNRPDIQAYRWKSTQARASVVTEYRKAYPDVAPMFGYTRQYQRKAIGFPDANSWTAAVTVSLPLFDRNQGNRAKAASVLAQSQYDYQAAVNDLRAEVETAAQEYRSAQANAAEVAADQLRVAREILDAIAAAYQVGGRPLLELFDAQRNYRDTYRAYITSRAHYWRAVFRYRAAIGQQSPK